LNYFHVVPFILVFLAFMVWFLALYALCCLIFHAGGFIHFRLSSDTLWLWWHVFILYCAFTFTIHFNFLLCISTFIYFVFFHVSASGSLDIGQLSVCFIYLSSNCILCLVPLFWQSLSLCEWFLLCSVYNCLLLLNEGFLINFLSSLGVNKFCD